MRRDLADDLLLIFSSLSSKNNILATEGQKPSKFSCSAQDDTASLVELKNLFSYFWFLIVFILLALIWACLFDLQFGGYRPAHCSPDVSAKQNCIATVR